MISINGKYYKLDLEKICNFAVTSEKKPTEREIIDNYTFTGSERKLDQKTVREFQTFSYDNVKYDLIKTLVFTLLAYDIDNNGITDEEELPLGVSICLNTLIADGYLVEITKEKGKK